MLRQKKTILIFLVFFGVSVASIAQKSVKPVVWSEPSLDLSVFEDIKALSFEGLVRYIEEKLEIPVVIDKDFQSDAELNKSLESLENSPRSEKILQALKETEQTPLTQNNKSGDSAIYLPPRYVFNLNQGRTSTRYAFDTPVIILTRYATRSSLIEELLHHLHYEATHREEKREKVFSSAPSNSFHWITENNFKMMEYQKIFDERMSTYKIHHNIFCSLPPENGDRARIEVALSKSYFQLAETFLHYDFEALMTEFRVSNEELYLKKIIQAHYEELRVSRYERNGLYLDRLYHLEKLHQRFDLFRKHPLYSVADSYYKKILENKNNQPLDLESHAFVDFFDGVETASKDIEAVLSQKYGELLREVVLKARKQAQLQAVCQKIFSFLTEKKRVFLKAQNKGSENWVLWTGLSVMKETD